MPAVMPRRRRWTRFLHAAPLIAATLAQPAAGAAPAAPRASARPPAPAAPTQPTVPAGATAAPPAALAEDLTKELAKGNLLVQLEQKGKLPKRAFAPPEKLIKPYSGASLGAPLAYHLVQGTEFVSAPAAEALGQSVLDRLLGVLAVPQPNLRVRIVAEPNYGAQVTETGLVLVSLGTFNPDPSKGAATADELALLLGHEVSHILLGHMEKGRTMRKVLNALSYSASAYMSYSALKDSRMVNGQLRADVDKGMMMRGLVGGLAASTLVGDLLVPSFDRGRELEADRLGIDLARRAGYVVAAGEVRHFVSRHAEDNIRRSRRMNNLQTVLNALTAEAGTVAAKEVGDNGNLVKGLISVVGNVLSEELVKAISSQTKNHPNVAERTAFVERYVNTYHGNAETGPDGRLLRRNRAAMEAIGRAGDFAALLDQVRRADDLRQALTETVPTAAGPDPFAAVLRDAGVKPPPAPPKGKKGRGRAPAPTVQSGGAFGTDAAAFTWEMQGLVQLRKGDAGGAQTAWRRGLRSDYASLGMGRRLGDTVPGAAATGELDALIGRYKRLIGTTDPVLDLVVGAALAKGDVAAAELAAARCVTYDGGRLYPRCAGVLGYNPLAKGTSAKTPQGIKAFAGKSMEKSFRDLLAITDIFE
jgi:Zn-dependent protease with chaperone function